MPVTFANGSNALGLYIYSNAPAYTPVEAAGEGFTCVDDVARGVLFYLRSTAFATDTAVQQKVYGLMHFILNMQSANGYFYNFLQAGNIINTSGATSVDQPKWWSWRALQALTEAAPIIQNKNTQLAGEVNQAVNKLIAAIKTGPANAPQTTTQIDGIPVPQWLPEGADQAATLILGLVPYCAATGDTTIKAYIKKLADGIKLTQLGDATNFPYGAFLSSGTLWHAYGNEQANALFKAGLFFNDTTYLNSAKGEVDNFYPWLINTGFKNSFQVKLVNNVITPYNTQEFEQIAYGIRPMVFAAIDAYEITGDEKYADLAGHLAAWFFANNTAAATMYSTSTGICFDAIADGNTVNKNSGAESTIEALLTMQRVSDFTTVKVALNKYKR